MHVNLPATGQYEVWLVVLNPLPTCPAFGTPTMELMAVKANTFFYNPCECSAVVADRRVLLGATSRTVKLWCQMRVHVRALYASCDWRNRSPSGILLLLYRSFSPS